MINDKTLLFFIGTLLMISLNLKAQDEIAVYKKIFAYADSLSKAPQKGVVSEGIFNVLADLDKKNPVFFFEKVGELIKAGQINDASFVFYVGYFRYEYFNVTNPGYKPGEREESIVASNPGVSQSINMFLRSDIDNFIKILEHTKNWLANNDYQFNSKTKDVEEYKKAITNLDALINDFTNNKAKYQTQWATEQNEIRKAINEMKN
jgi:hypothetical protein